MLLAGSCGKGVEKVITLTFTKEAPESVTISTSTELGAAEKGTPEAAVIDREREALLNGTDEWTVRFASADPEFERITVQRNKKQLERVEHTGVVPVGNLQRFFFDTALTVNVVQGPGWSELTINAGASNRASNREKNHVAELLGKFSEQAVRYFSATRAIYDYLDSNDSRSDAIFFTLAATVLGDKKDANAPPLPELSDNEQKLVASAANAITALIDDQQGGSGNVDREFDATFNPFPAELRVVVPGEPIEVEGFNRPKEGGLVIKSADVLEALAALEGKWVKPDLLAALINAGDSPEARANFVTAMKSQPRHAADVVRSDEVREALISRMRPADRYRVRWIVTAAATRRSSS